MIVDGRYKVYFKSPLYTFYHRYMGTLVEIYDVNFTLLKNEKKRRDLNITK